MYKHESSTLYALKKVCSLISCSNDYVNIQGGGVCVTEPVQLKNKFSHAVVAKNEE